MWECGRTIRTASAVIELKKSLGATERPLPEEPFFHLLDLAYWRKTLHEWSNIFVKGACASCCWDTLLSPGLS